MQFGYLVGTVKLFLHLQLYPSIPCYNLLIDIFDLTVCNSLLYAFSGHGHNGSHPGDLNVIHNRSFMEESSPKNVTFPPVVTMMELFCYTSQIILKSMHLHIRFLPLK